MTDKDQASFEAHFVTSYVKVVMETIGAENLFANEADMKICKLVIKKIYMNQDLLMS